MHRTSQPRRTTPETEAGIDGFELESRYPRDSDIEIENTPLVRGHQVSRDSFEHVPNQPIRVKVTAYRLLTTCLILSFGTAKAIEGLRTGAVTATWLEWAFGCIITAVMYWLGLYESLQPPVASWFFHEDYLPDLFYVPLNFVFYAIVLGSMFATVQYLTMAFAMIVKHVFPNNPLGNPSASVLAAVLEWCFWLLLFPFLPLGLGVVAGFLFGIIFALKYLHFTCRKLPMYRRISTRMFHRVSRLAAGLNNRVENHQFLYLFTIILALYAQMLVISYFKLPGEIDW